MRNQKEQTEPTGRILHWWYRTDIAANAAENTDKRIAGVDDEDAEDATIAAGLPCQEGNEMLPIFVGMLLAVTLLQDANVIRRAAVGSVSIGSDAESIYSAFGDRAKLIDLGLEGNLTPALKLTFPGARTDGGVVAEFVAENSRLVVSRIHVTDPQLRTEKGIGVGSTVMQLRAQYQLGEMTSGEGRVGVVVEDLGATFVLDTSGRTPLSTIRQPSELPGDVKIVEIVLFRR